MWDNEFPYWAQDAQKLYFENYNVSNLHFEQGYSFHWYGGDKYVNFIKQMYLDLRYTTGFSSDRSNYSAYGEWLKFDQGEFVGIDSTKGEAWNFNETGFNDSGYVYIPDVCTYSTCKLHVTFHGCLSGVSSYA